MKWPIETGPMQLSVHRLPKNQTESVFVEPPDLLEKV